MKPDYILCKKLSTRGEYMRMARKKILIWKMHYYIEVPMREIEHTSARVIYIGKSKGVLQHDGLHTKRILNR